MKTKATNNEQIYDPFDEPAETNHEEALRKFEEKFPIEAHSWRTLRRTQNGQFVVYYVDLREMERRLQSVVGLNYTVTVSEPTVIGNTVYVRATLNIPKFGFNLSDYGASPIENEEAVKSATTDAYRRVLSHLGIGRYLYLLPKVFIAGRDKPNEDPIKVLESVMKDGRNSDDVVFFGGYPDENSKPSTDGRTPPIEDKQLHRWAAALGCSADKESILAELRGIYERATDKQLAVVIRNADPDEILNDTGDGVRKFLDRFFAKA